MTSTSTLLNFPVCCSAAMALCTFSVENVSPSFCKTKGRKASTSTLGLATKLHNCDLLAFVGIQLLGLLGVKRRCEAAPGREKHQQNRPYRQGALSCSRAACRRCAAMANECAERGAQASADGLSLPDRLRDAGFEGLANPFQSREHVADHSVSPLPLFLGGLSSFVHYTLDALADLDGIVEQIA